MARRVQTEAPDLQHQFYDLDNLSDPEDDVYMVDQDEGVDEDEYGGEEGEGEDEEGQDLNNYKGIYFQDDTGKKFTDPETGAHYQYQDMCQRISKLMVERAAIDKQIFGEEAVRQMLKEQQQFDPEQMKKEQLQREKEEFLKNLGIQKKQKTTNQEQQ